MRQAYAFLFGFVCIAGLCTRTQAQPTLNVKEVIEKAKQEESSIQSGSLILLETTKHNLQTEADIKRSVKATNSSQQGALQIESETPPVINGKRVILFDNQRSALRLEYSDDHQATLQRVYLDDKVTKVYDETKNVTDPSKPYVPTYQVTKPLPRWNDYNLLLVSRFWRNLDTEGARAKQADGRLLIDLPSRNRYRQFVELDPHQNYAIKSIKTIDLKRRRTHSEIRVTRTLRGGIWYPAAITQFQYDVNAPIDKKLIDTTVTDVQSAALNIPVAEKDLEVGDTPANTHVTDDRFGHPVDYQQGIKQFTDAEMQKLSANPEQLRRAAAETSVEYVKAQQERTVSQRVRAGLTALVGLSSGTILILTGRRVLRRSV